MLPSSYGKTFPLSHLHLQGGSVCCGTCRALVPAEKACPLGSGFRSSVNRNQILVCKPKSHSALKIGKSARDDLAYEHKCRLWSTCRDLEVLRGDPHVNQITCLWCLPTHPSRPGIMKFFEEDGPPSFSAEDTSPTGHQDPHPCPASSTAPCKTLGLSNTSPRRLDCVPPWSKGPQPHLPTRNPWWSSSVVPCRCNTRHWAEQMGKQP